MVLLNAGASAININIVQGDQSVFTRDISIGGNAYTEAVQKELGLSFEAAEQLKRGSPGRRRHGRGRAAGAARRHRERGARGAEDARVLQGHGGGRAHRSVVLSGGVSRVEGLRELLEERLHAPVEYFDPFRNVKWDAAKLGNVDPALVASTAAVAVGLALRQAGDR